VEKPPARLDLLRAIDREIGAHPSYRPLPSAVVPRNPSSKPN
jgi:hypothetical protein